MSISDNNIARVSIEKTTYEKFDCKSLIKPLGGITKYISKGEKVLLKTNLLNASEPDRSIVTNPIFIKKIALEILNNNAIPYIGDSPSGPFTKRRLEKVYLKSGLIKLSNEIGIDLNYNTKSQKILIPKGKRLKKA